MNYKFMKCGIEVGNFDHHVRLKREINNIWLGLIFITLTSCANSEKPNVAIFQDEYINQNFSLYKVIYEAISDTLAKWKNDSLANSGPYFLESNDHSKLESLILFNSDSTRLYTYHLEQNVVFKNSSVDNLAALAGAKINGKWYFFFGPSTVIDRASYQDSVYAPLTFDELSYLAREHMQGALYRDSGGVVKVKDKWLDFINNRNDWGLPSYSSLEQLDSLIVFKNRDKYTRKIDITELAEINQEIAASIQPPEPSDTRSWYQKVFSSKKLFETDEWKAYVKSKSEQ